MKWTEYAVSMLPLQRRHHLVLYVMQRVQLSLPWNPQKLAGVGPELAFTQLGRLPPTPIGKTTRRVHHELLHADWRAWRTTTSLSAAVGIALAIAFIRGLHAVKRRRSAISGLI